MENNHHHLHLLLSKAKLIELKYLFLFFFNNRNFTVAFGLIVFIGLSMVASSARAPVAYISFATLSHVHLPALISVLSSVLSITANLSVDGSTNGNPTWK